VLLNAGRLVLVQVLEDFEPHEYAGNCRTHAHAHTTRTRQCQCAVVRDETEAEPSSPVKLFKVEVARRRHVGRLEDPRRLLLCAATTFNYLIFISLKNI
jgi:hypothetical protein